MFQGKLVRLRAVKETDIPILATWYADTEVMTHQTSGALLPKSQAALEELVRGWSQDSPSQAAFAIERLSDEALLGIVNLWGLGPTSRYATLAVMLGKPFWSQGYGGEALRLLLTFAFDELGLHRIQLTVNADNERAVRAYERAGFVVEGRARDAYYRAGGWRDMLWMGVLEHEFTR